MEYKLFIDGKWTGESPSLEVTNKYSGETIATFSQASREDAKAAIDAAIRAASVMAQMPTYQRSAILAKTAQLLQERYEDFATTIAAEAGKALKFARAEVDRAIGTFTFAAEEAKRIHGETIPLDAIPAGEGYFGFYRRIPVGVVVAIGPFNFPLNLIAHKVAPAIAAGNSVVLKPASTTPITAAKLCQILVEAGLPPGAINLIIGSGRTVGEWLVSDERVAKVSFTGSPEVGKRITELTGIKKVTLELGNTSPVIIAADADIGTAAKRCAVGAYYNSGQVCISVQRIYVQRPAYEPFLDEFVKASQAMVVGDPLDESVDVGPMIDLKEAERIEDWVGEAQNEGARVLTGGQRQGCVYLPTVLTDVTPEMKVIAEEAFAPIASVVPCQDFEEAVHLAGATDYALQVGVFTKDIYRVFQSMDRLHFGGVIINDTAAFRVDHMPYGGNRKSGIGREGLRFAIEDMTNIQMVAIRLTT
jgi:acyl-CoA reductase-like NAD-dependent aldehyde dehydrogenase